MYRPVTTVRSSRPDLEEYCYTMRFGTTTKLVAKCMLKHYRISSCPDSKLAVMHTEQFQQAFLELAGAAGLNEAALRATLSQELPHTTNRWSRRIQEQASICQQGLGLAAGAAAVISNGRIVPVGPGADEGIVAEDFRLMETWAKTHQLSTRVGGSWRFISSDRNVLASWNHSSSPALPSLYNHMY